MTLVTLVALIVRVAVTVGVMLAIAAVAIVGRTRLASVRAQYRERRRAIAPYLVVLAGVLVVNNATRKFAPEVSWLIRLNVTGIIYAIEGTFVAHLQSVATPLLTAYFSFMYVYGYVFLLAFPLVAYFALEETKFMRETCVAYTLNYGVGLLCYVAFIAYGPRNLMPDLVEPLLYASWPRSQFLTSQVNTNTNVFPSLHGSLSFTVALLAYRTREIYPAWSVVATIFAGSVIVSTMYLGIHWLIDVVAGGGLALFAVWVATNLDETTAARYRTKLTENRTYVHVGRWVRLLRDAVNARR